MGKKSVLIWILIAIVLGIISFMYDSQIADFFKSVQSPILSYILDIFRPVTAMIVLGIIFVIVLIMKHKRKWALPLALTLIISVAVSFILKFVFMRSRPFGLTETIAFTTLPDFSFPSSHVTFIFAALPFLNKEFPRLRCLWWIVAVLIALSRLYFTDHYLSDTIFGAVIGYSIGLLFIWLEKKYSFGERLVKRIKKV